MSDNPFYDETVASEGTDPTKKNFERITEDSDYSEEMETTEQVQTVESPEQIAEEPQARVLTAWDTCDRCGPSVVALVLAVKDESEVILCTHHGKKYAPVMEEQGFTVTFFEGPS